MNPFAIASVGASAVTLALSIWLLLTGSTSASRQTRLQEKQKELQSQQLQFQTQQLKLQEIQTRVNQTNAFAQQVDQVIRDLATLSLQKKNEKIRGVLDKYGIKFQAQDGAASSSTGATTTPAATPTTAPGATPAPR